MSLGPDYRASHTIVPQTDNLSRPHPAISTLVKAFDLRGHSSEQLVTVRVRNERLKILKFARVSMKRARVTCMMFTIFGILFLPA